MEARRKWATAVVVIIALVAGASGSVYLWKEAFPSDTDAARDGGPAGDSSADARGRGKPKVAKRGARPGKPRGAPRPSGPRGAVQSSGGQTSVDRLAANDDGQGEGATDDETVEEFRPPFRGRGPAGPTYEAAVASNNQEVTMGGKPEPDLTDAQLSLPMRNGVFVGECGAPDSTKVTVKVAIKRGRPVGVSVSTNPPDADVAGCIDRYVRTFFWPSSSKLDSFTTTY